MIQVHNLRKVYNGTAALDGFNLHVAEGELFGLVGPNGAGKSTLIKTLATLIRPTEGTAKVSGIDVQYGAEEVKRLIGYMPDQPGLYQDMRLREFLQFFADAFHISRHDQPGVIDAALLRSGLADRQQLFVEELSFGLKQGLFLAKTLLHNPKLLLLDEPATGLDPIARLDLRQQLKDLHAAGVTILISSHILSDLEDICTRVALISKGKNLTGIDGEEGIRMTRPSATTRLYEIEVFGSREVAGEIIDATAGAKVISAEKERLTVEISGGSAEAASLLRHLVTSGVDIVRFDNHAASLETLYQKVFGAQQP